ncbi:MAG: UDP-N-acetyl-D-glucosamine dehydrogenase, partial [Burkholderiales bacterium]
YKLDMRSVELTRQTISGYDCVLIATDHDAFDYDLIKQCAALVVDTRGVYGEASANIVKA